MSRELTETERAANRLLGLKEYNVWAREVVYSCITVWAMNEDEAGNLANNEGFDKDDIVDSADFEITDVEEVKDE